MPKKSEGGNIQVALASSLISNGSSIPGIHEGFPLFRVSWETVQGNDGLAQVPCTRRRRFPFLYIRGRSASQLYGDGATAHMVPDSCIIALYSNRRFAYVTRVICPTDTYDTAEIEPEEGIYHHATSPDCLRVEFTASLAR